MVTIVCKVCDIEKEASTLNFKIESRTKLGFCTTCKDCRNKKSALDRKENPDKYKEIDKRNRQTKSYQIYQDSYRDTNKDALRKYHKSKYQENKEPYLLRSKEQKIRLGDSYKVYQKEYKKKNIKILNEKYLHKLKTDPNTKLRHTLRGRFRKLIKGFHKKNSVLSYLGCDVEFLKNWIASKFRGEMSWENHGSIWHIDHVIPCVSFDFSNEDDLRKCWHYTNLQPLYAEENLSKGDKLV